MATIMSVRRILARQFATAAVHGHGGADAGKTAGMWKKIFLFVALPCCALGQLNCYLMNKEEEEHFERPPFVQYDCVRIRNKRYPWGDGQKTLFHNPHRNALPSGYEDEH